MNKITRNLRRVLIDFLDESEKILNLLAKGKVKLTVKDLELLAEKVRELRARAIEVIASQEDEESAYNAEILKEALDAPLSIQGRMVSLTEACDMAIKHHDISTLKILLNTWNLERSLFDVFHTDLRQISQELAA